MKNSPGSLTVGLIGIALAISAGYALASPAGPFASATPIRPAVAEVSYPAEESRPYVPAWDAAAGGGCGGPGALVSGDGPSVPVPVPYY